MPTALKVHLIGIGGTGMGAVAGLLASSGHEVRGSDTAVYPPMSEQLAALGIPVFTGYAAANLDWGPDLVVVGNVHGKDHVEVVAAQAKGIPLTFESGFGYVEELRRKAFEHIGSTTGDMQSKKMTEIDAMNGAVVREGRKLGLATPVNEVITNFVHLLESTRADRLPIAI